MRDYGIVRGRFWAWAKENKLSVDAQQLAIYCLTSPHTVGTGCFRLPLSYIAEDLGTVTDTVRDTVSELSKIGFLRHDERSGWIWIVGFLDHNPIANGNVGKSLIPFIDSVPRKLPFYKEFLLSLKAQQDRFPNGYIDGLLNGIGNGSGNGMPNHDQEHDHDHDHQHEDTKAKALGADAPFDLKALWDDGVKLLVAHGNTERNARSKIGQWRQKHGDERTHAGIKAAQESCVSEPIGWISKWLAAPHNSDRLTAEQVLAQAVGMKGLVA